ncbi:T9SS type A sorting domain-containing protein, partial [Bacteroidota bacterium]
CAGDSITLDPGAGYVAYAWSNGDITQTSVVDAAGTYSVTVTDALGRQAIDDVDVYVNALPTVDLGPDTNQCEGSVTLDAGVFNGYLWSGSETTQQISVSTSGLYAVTITDSEGCNAEDSINVNIYPYPTPDLGSDIVICEGGSETIDAGIYDAYLWSDLSTNQTLTVGGAGTFSVTVTENGCEGNDTIIITTSPALETDDEAIICYGESYNGNTTSGIYTDTLSDVNGCDSIVHLTLTVLPEIFTIEDVTLCTGASYKGYSSAGTYYQTLTAANGCDSIIEINITESTEILITNYIDICEGESYNGHTTSGTYDDSAIASVGCDSINRVVLTVNPVTTTIENATICFGESYKGHTIGGTYFETLTAITGCDSIIQTNLTVNPPPVYDISDDATIVQGSSIQLFVSGGISYYWSPGASLDNDIISNPTAEPTITTTYIIEIENAFGCIAIDSIKVTVIETADNTQEIPLSAGWNIISLNIQPSSNDMLEIVQPLIDNNTLVKVMNESGLSIVEISNVWNNFIDNFKASEGYLVKVNNIDTLVISGIAFNTDIKIGLLRGWNIISYPKKTSKAGEDVLASLMNRETLVKVQDESGLSIEKIMPLGWINNIGNFNPGEGYKVRVNQITAFTYGDILLKSAVIDNALLDAEPTYFTPVWSGNGLDHMNLYSKDIQINNIEIQVGDEIGVFDGELCVGVVKFENYTNGYIPIVASKDDPTTEEIDGYTVGNPIKLKIWDESEQIELTNPEVVFIDNSTDKFTELGTSIFTLKAKSETTNVNPDLIISTNLGDAYPNPFSLETIIDFSLNEETEVVIGIFNLLGEEVFTLINNTLPAGNHQILWNRRDEKGIAVPAGIYLYRMETDGYTQTKQLIIQ